MGPKGLTVRTEDKNFVFNVRFPLMFDAKATLDNELPRGGDGFYPRFFGPLLSPTIYGIVTGKLLVGFQDKSVSVVTAYMDVEASPWLHLRLGKLLYPIALERQVSPLRIVMMEHGLASSLLPVSEFGAMLWGGPTSKVFEYQLTFGNGAPANQYYETDVDDRKDGIGRVYTRPFAQAGNDWLAGIGFGVGGSYGKHRGTPTAPLTGTSKTLGGRVFYSMRNNSQDAASTTLADGTILRFVPHAAYVAGPISAYAEYVRVREDVAIGATEATLTHESFHAVAAVVLTGERAVQLDIVVPERPLNVAQGHFGAVELTGRFETIRYDSDTFPTFADPATAARKATAFGGGFNWVPVELVRLTVNFEHTRFEGANGAPTPRSENLLGSRLQALF